MNDKYLGWRHMFKLSMAFALVLVNVLQQSHVDYLVNGRPTTPCDLQTIERIVRIVWARAIMDNMEHNTHDQGHD